MQRAGAERFGAPNSWAVLCSWVSVRDGMCVTASLGQWATQAAHGSVHLLAGVCGYRCSDLDFGVHSVNAELQFPACSCWISVLALPQYCPVIISVVSYFELLPLPCFYFFALFGCWCWNSWKRAAFSSVRGFQHQLSRVLFAQTSASLTS